MAEDNTSPQSGPTGLEDAWRRFAVYDHHASAVQRKFLALRIGIWVLGVAATTLAVVYAQVKPAEIKVLEPPDWSQWQFYLWLLVVAVPITASVLVAGAAKLDRGVTAILLRSAAEAIKREIYRYRCRVAIYREHAPQSRTREERLAERVEAITGRLLDTDVMQSSLEPYRGKLPPQFGVAGDDDGFTDLTPEQYVAWRLDDQLAYMQGKAVKLDRQGRRLQWAIAGLGGVGTFLAAINLELWLPVSVALATALTGFLQLRGIDVQLAGCSRTALELENIKTWWQGMSAESRQDAGRFAALVRKTESLLQSENAEWAAEMQEAIKEVEEEKKEEGGISSGV